MSLPEPTRRRLPRIKAGLLEGKTSAETGKECGVTKKTIDRDLQKWRGSGEFEEWIKEEWTRLHFIIQQKDPKEAYRQLTSLLGKTFTRRVESKTEVSGGATPIIIKMWKPPEDEPAS